jgi:hypothetical protein
MKQLGSDPWNASRGQGHGKIITRQDCAGRGHGLQA